MMLNKNEAQIKYKARMTLRHCIDCGAERWIPNYLYSRDRRIRCQRCNITRVNKSRTKNKDERALHKQGYRWILIDPEDKYACMASKRYKKGRKSRSLYVFEHRLVMARHLNRPLNDDEIVHHKNGIKNDNRIENLEITRRGKHIKEHAKGYYDGFNIGYKDGTDKQIIELKEKIRILESQIQSLKMLQSWSRGQLALSETLS